MDGDAQSFDKLLPASFDARRGAMPGTWRFAVLQNTDARGCCENKINGDFVIQWKGP